MAKKIMTEADYNAEYETDECMWEGFPQSKVSFSVRIDHLMGGNNGSTCTPVENGYCIRGEVVGYDGSKLVLEKLNSPLVDIWVTKEFLQTHGIPVPDWNCMEGIEYYGQPESQLQVVDITCETLFIEPMDMWFFICRECGTNFDICYEWGS